MITTGIPSKVDMNDSVEFLELGKHAAAFLDLGLEKIKGGIRNQLLCGHLVAFIQENGLEAIKTLPRFKSEYLEEIISKYNNKGINLFELRIDPPNLIIEKINKKEKFKTKNFMKTAMAEISTKRKTFAEHFLEGLKTKFQSFSPKIKMATKRFTSSSEGFELLVPIEGADQIQNYFTERKTQYAYQGNGNFLILYPESLSEKKDQPKSLINLCEKERANVLRVLKNAKYLQRKGGHVKDVGVFSINQSASIAANRSLKIKILNKSVDTVNQILKVIKNYYSTHERGSLVEAKIFQESFIIEISYQPNFFEVETVEQTEIPVVEIPGLEETTKADELSVMLDIAFEGDESILGDIEKLRQKREANKKEFLHSVSGLLTEVFWEIIGENGIKLFRDQMSEEGLQILSQVSVNELKEPISQRVLEKLNKK